MLNQVEDDILIEIYHKAINSNVENDIIFDNFINILRNELSKRGLLDRILSG